MPERKHFFPQENVPNRVAYIVCSACQGLGSRKSLGCSNKALSFDPDSIRNMKFKVYLLLHHSASPQLPRLPSLVTIIVVLLKFVMMGKIILLVLPLVSLLTAAPQNLKCQGKSVTIVHTNHTWVQAEEHEKKHHIRICVAQAVFGCIKKGWGG